MRATKKDKGIQSTGVPVWLKSLLAKLSMEGQLPMPQYHRAIHCHVGRVQHTRLRGKRGINILSNVTYVMCMCAVLLGQVTSHSLVCQQCLAQ